MLFFILGSWSNNVHTIVKDWRSVRALYTNWSPKGTGSHGGQCVSTEGHCCSDCWWCWVRKHMCQLLCCHNNAPSVLYLLKFCQLVTRWLSPDLNSFLRHHNIEENLHDVLTDDDDDDDDESRTIIAPIDCLVLKSKTCTRSIDSCWRSVFFQRLLLLFLLFGFAAAAVQAFEVLRVRWSRDSSFVLVRRRFSLETETWPTEFYQSVLSFFRMHRLMSGRQDSMDALQVIMKKWVLIAGCPLT